MSPAAKRICYIFALISHPMESAPRPVSKLFIIFVKQLQQKQCTRQTKLADMHFKTFLHQGLYDFQKNHVQNCELFVPSYFQ